MLDAPLVGEFLAALEQQRHNSVRTRNARLAVIHSLFRHAALRHPEHASQIARVLAIPAKNTRRGVISWLTDPEVESLLASPDQKTWTGRRDHLLMPTGPPADKDHDHHRNARRGDDRPHQR